MRELVLSKGRVALIDDVDFERASKYKWWLSDANRGVLYARANVGSDCVKLHRFILEIIDKNVIVDHIDGNGLNNTRSNLRIATASQNGANRKSSGVSRFLGVHQIRTRLKNGSINIAWMSSMTLNKKKIYLGCFRSEIDAARAYNEAAIKNHGAFAKLNTI